MNKNELDDQVTVSVPTLSGLGPTRKKSISLLASGEPQASTSIDVISKHVLGICANNLPVKTINRASSDNLIFMA